MVRRSLGGLGSPGLHAHNLSCCSVSLRTSCVKLPLSKSSQLTSLSGARHFTCSVSAAELRSARADISRGQAELSAGRLEAEQLSHALANASSLREEAETRHAKELNELRQELSLSRAEAVSLGQRLGEAERQGERSAQLASASQSELSSLREGELPSVVRRASEAETAAQEADR